MNPSFKPAVRDRVGLLIAIAGGTGSGKSFSALKIARGLCGGDDTKIRAIDTEAGRLKHYAPAPGERPGPDTFGFMHADMHPPFSPDAYTEIIAAADDGGCEVIVVDSGSHVWAGEGGVVDIHDFMLEKAVARAEEYHKKDGKGYPFDYDKTSERLSLGCWKDPKMDHKRFVSRLLQSRAHIILCLRAEEKMLMETKEETGANGKVYKKTIIVPAKDRPINERWSPICEKRLPFEFTVSLLLTADKPGCPIPLKLEERHRTAVPLDKPLSEETGRLLAEWARGGVKKEVVPRALDELISAGDAISLDGIDKLRQWWANAITEPERTLLGGHTGERLKAWKTVASKVPVKEAKQDNLPV